MIQPGLHHQGANDNWADVKVYLVRHSSREYLGTVTSFTSRDLRIPSQWIDTATPVRVLVVGFPGRASYQSPPVAAMPDSRLRLTVRDHLSTSSLFVINQ